MGGEKILITLITLIIFGLTAAMLIVDVVAYHIIFNFDIDDAENCLIESFSFRKYIHFRKLAFGLPSNVHFLENDFEQMSEKRLLSAVFFWGFSMCLLLLLSLFLLAQHVDKDKSLNMFILQSSIVIFSFSILSFIIGFNTVCHYYTVRHLKELRFVMDFLLPGGIPVSQKVSLIREVPYRKINSLFELDKATFDLFWNHFALNAELFDRVNLGAKILTQNDSHQMIENSRELLTEIVKTYDDLLDAIDQSLNRATHIAQCQRHVAEQKAILTAQHRGNHFAKEFQVIKELRGEDQNK